VQKGQGLINSSVSVCFSKVLAISKERFLKADLIPPPDPQHNVSSRERESS